jgi:hypothetical protein
MTTKPWLDKEEARGAIRGPKGWSIVLDKQWSTLSFPDGGLTVRRRPTGPLRHWPIPSVTTNGRL